VRTIAQRSHRWFLVPAINPVPPISSSSYRVWWVAASCGRRPHCPIRGIRVRDPLISTSLGGRGDDGTSCAHHWWSKDFVLAFESFLDWLGYAAEAPGAVLRKPADPKPL